MGKILQTLEKWIGGGPGGEKRVSAFRWLLLTGLIGVGLMILNSFITIKEVNPSSESNSLSPHAQQAFQGSEGRDKSPFRESEAAYESAVKELLQKVVGVGEVDVMVTIDSTEEVVVKESVRDTQQVTEEKDRNGASRHITDISRSGEIVLYQSNGSQQPLVLKKIKPKIRGVVIVARGAENATVKKMIVEAVGRGLEVPVHRISILPRKQ